MLGTKLSSGFSKVVQQRTLRMNQWTGLDTRFPDTSHHILVTAWPGNFHDISMPILLRTLGSQSVCEQSLHSQGVERAHMGCNQSQ